MSCRPLAGPGALLQTFFCKLGVMQHQRRLWSEFELVLRTHVRYVTEPWEPFSRFLELPEKQVTFQTVISTTRSGADLLDLARFQLYETYRYTTPIYGVAKSGSRLGSPADLWYTELLRCFLLHVWYLWYLRQICLISTIILRYIEVEVNCLIKCVSSGTSLLGCLGSAVYTDSRQQVGGCSLPHGSN